jgi:hypothetical protein
MTPEQRNDLCIEWDYASNTVKEKILREYKEKHASSSPWEDWEEFLAQKLNIRQFWQTVGLM